MSVFRSIMKTLIPQPLLSEGLNLYDSVYDRGLALRADAQYYRRERPTVESTTGGPDHIVCVVVDAMRGDSISPETTPFLDSLAGTKRAVSPAPWTFPSVTSILTGMYPHEHGAMRQTDDPDLASSNTLPPQLPSDDFVAPDYFAAAGYDTYAGMGFPMPLFAVGGAFKKHRLYDDSTTDSNSDCKTVLSDYFSWLESRSASQTFAYLHLADMHSPISPPAEYWERHDVDPSIIDITRWDYESGGTSDDAHRYMEHKKRLYRAAADYVDDELNHLFERLNSLLDEDVAFVVTSDHGELFWDQAAIDDEYFYDHRGYTSLGHGGTPFEGVTRVPLLGKNIEIPEGPTSLTDLLPLLLDTAGIQPQTERTGLSDAAENDGVLLTEATRYGYEKKAVATNGWKLIVSHGDGHRLGFRLPEEELTELPDDVETRLLDALPDWPEGGQMSDVSPTAKRRLEKLGYMQE